MTTAGIYIHIPFCNVKCMYCDFYSVADRNLDQPRFFEALIKEINRFDFTSITEQFDTLFIGGGTPSLMSPNQLELILKALSDKIVFSALTEITMEVNPGEAPFDKLVEFYSLGINRLSIGIQSLEPSLLTFLTRIHTVEDVFSSFKSARKAGFNNINCDIIFNIPGQTKQILQRDLKTIIDLEPEHISTYSLTVEHGTKLNKLVSAGEVLMPSIEVDAEMYQMTREILSNNGFEQYEISNFSKSGKECLHNLHYWHIEPYIGFGPSAHSFDGIRRWNNVRLLDQYMKKMEEDLSPISTSEDLTLIQKINEKIGFGLRLNEGIDLDKLSETHKKQFNQNVEQHRNKWDGYIDKVGNKIKLHEKGIAFADAIAVDLILQ